MAKQTEQEISDWASKRYDDLPDHMKERIAKDASSFFKTSEKYAVILEGYLDFMHRLGLADNLGGYQDGLNSAEEKFSQMYVRRD